MKNSDYWRKRFQQLEETQYLQGEEYCKVLREQFRIAANSIQADIEKWYYRLAENNNISYLAAKKFLTTSQRKEFQWTLEEYIKYGQENALNQKWVKELENASAKYHISYLEAMKLQIQQEAEKLFMEYENGTAGLLGKVYTDSFYHSAYEIAKGTGVGTNFHALNATQIEKVLKRPWAVDGANYSDRIWKNKEKLLNTLNTELAQNIIRGNSFHDISRRIAKQMDAGMKQAMRLIQTEEAAIAASSQEDCYMELGIEEFEVVETLDSRTCEFCAYMDGKHFPMKEYKIGTTVPPFHPNCRGCTCPYFNDEFTAHEKWIARGEDGRNYYVSGNMTYKEWKNTFVSEVKNKPEYLQIRDWEKLDIATLQSINNELELIPEQNQIVLEQAEIQIEVVKNTPSHYDFRNHTLYITQMFEPYEIVHEAAHALEDVLGIWNDKSFRRILDNIKQNHVISDIIKDTETFIKPILYIKDDRFVSIYQGRIYEGVEELEIDGKINVDLLWDYFSEGYRCYIENPKFLQKKDKELYDYIKEMVLHE